MSSAKKILELNSVNLDYCAQVLRNDHLVAIPTETVYGLAGNSLSKTAVMKIFSVKGRPLIDPLISHFFSASAAFDHVIENPSARTLAETFWPGPLTIILPKKSTIPDLVTAGLPSAAIRVPAHPALRDLLRRLDFPLAAPSANPFGYVSPTRPDHVFMTLGSQITAILDGGVCQHGIESTIIDLRDEKTPKILRPGPISAQTLSDTLHTRVRINSAADHAEDSALSAPGMLAQHYSPKAKIEIRRFGQTLPEKIDAFPEERTAMILNSKPKTAARIPDNIFWLSETSDLESIARNFFHLIQKCDQQGYARLIVEESPNEGIGVAINDRLHRAAAAK